MGVAPSLSRGERDLPRRVARLAAAADRGATWSVGRGLLAAVALRILVFSVPALVMGDEQDTSTHAARHLGAFTVAYAAGLLVVVVRPARARTMLPVAAVLAGALLVTAVVDLANGRIPLVNEARHLPEVLSVVLVWLIAVPSPRWRPGAMRSVSRRTDDESAGPGLSSALPVVPDDRRAG